MGSTAFVLWLAIGATASATPPDPPLHEWAGAQLAHVPAGLRATVPRADFPVDATTRRNLDARADPVARNVYISSVYALMARELNACTTPGTRLGNWYHFATWASVSGGEVITRRKFDALGAPERAALWATAALGAVPSEDARADVMANANFLIALEMIPLGRAFLDLFCTGDGPPPPFSAFAARFRPENDHERSLLRAFALYHRAIGARDADARVELVTAASILQVVSEQTRVDEIIRAFFGGDFPLDAVTALYRRVATHYGPLHVGGAAPLRVRLDEDVPAVHTAPSLRDSSTPALRAVNAQLGLPHRIARRVLAWPGTATVDWCDLADRRRFLAALFRGFNTVDALFVPPYADLAPLDSVRDYHHRLALSSRDGRGRALARARPRR